MQSTVVALFIATGLAIASSQSSAETKWSISNPQKEGWNELAKTKLYFHNSDLQRLWAEAAIAKFSITPTDHLLDFGSGDGKISAALSYRAASVTGVDLSAAMINFARRKYPSSQFTHLDFKQAQSIDFSDLNFPTKFDSVVSFCVFHLVKSPVETLSNIRNQMNKGGRLLLVIPAISENNKFVQAALPTLKRFKITLPGNTPEKEGSLNIRIPKDTEVILTKAGFTVDAVDLKVERYHFYDDAEFIQWAKGTTSANWGIPKKIEKPFYHQFIVEYLKIDPAARGADGDFAPMMSHLVATAKNPG